MDEMRKNGGIGWERNLENGWLLPFEAKLLLYK